MSDLPSAIEWDDSLITGVKAIDDQHRVIVERLGLLHEAIAMGEGNTIIDQMVLDLEEYAGEHFRSEEALFEKYRYPEAGEHVDAHRKFLLEVASYREALRSGKVLDPRSVYSYLRNWIHDHLMEMDMRYCPFFQKLGVR